MYSGKICVSVADKSLDGLLKSACLAEKDGDVIEIRLDSAEGASPAPFITSIKKPLLFTNRASWEGGECSRPETARVAVLTKAVELGSSYIDIELKTDNTLRQELITYAKQNTTSVIISWHNFTTTPSSQALNTILQDQYKSGAHIGKIVTMAKTFQDVLRVLALQVTAAEIGFPLIAFCMGKAGRISRVATLELGGFMTYAAGSGGTTAPGQFEASNLNKMMENISNDD